jgi:hypothetical protein
LLKGFSAGQDIESVDFAVFRNQREFHVSLSESIHELYDQIL